MLKPFFPLGVSVLFAAFVAIGCDSKGDTGAAGAKGATGSTVVVTPAASLSMVSPPTGLLGGNGDYVITLENETLTDTVALDFGNDITTDNPALISTSSIAVHLSIATTAVVGPRDVRIIFDDTVVTGTNAFEVEAPVILRPTPPSTTTVAGQGSLLFLALTDLDPTGAWDSTPGGFTVTSPFGGLLATGVGGANTTATNAYVALAADPLAPIGPAQLTASNVNADGVALLSLLSAPSAVSVTAASPRVVAAGTSLTAENLPQAGASNYYSLTTSATSIVDISTTATGATISPTALAYPSSGVFADLLLDAAPVSSLFGNQPAPDVVFGTGSTQATTFVVVFDGAFGGGAAADYGYALKVNVAPATPVTEMSGPHADDDSAQALTPAGGIVVSGTLKVAGETDIYSFNAAAGDQWEFSYTESPSSIFGAGLDNGGLPDLSGNPLVVLQATAPSHSVSNQGQVSPIVSSPPDAGAANLPGTYYIAVVGGTSQAPNQPYTFTLLNLTP